MYSTQWGLLLLSLLLVFMFFFSSATKYVTSKYETI